MSEAPGEADDDVATAVVDETTAVVDETTAVAGPGRSAVLPRADSDTEDLPPGHLIDRFILIRKIGEGGLGRVFVAYDPKLDRKVAIKLLRPRGPRGSRSGDPAAAAAGRAMLEHEAQAMAKLSHPNVVAVYDVGVVGDEVFVAMEYVEGSTLRAWLRAKARPQAAILAMLAQAGRGLQAAHRARLVHRDFKPDNVIVGADGRARVLDFGLAQATRRGRDPTAGRPLTASASGDRGFQGTPAYMAPEQFTAEEGDARSDIYAFGVTLWEALVGARPFAADSVTELRRAVISGAFREPPRERRLPRRLDRLLRRALAAEPEARQNSMDEVLRELTRDPWRRLRQLAWAAAVALVLAAVVTLGVLATRPGEVAIAVEGPYGALRPSAALLGDQAMELHPQGARLALAPGVYRLRVEAPGMVPHETIVEVERGRQQHLEVTLEPIRGYLSVEASPPGTSLLVHGVDYGSRIRHLPLATGEYTLQGRMLGYYEYRERVGVAADTELDTYVSLAPALLWSHRQTGTAFPSQWIGDLTGDGLPELAHRVFNVLTISDPWGDRALWTRRMPPNPGHHLLWVDQDGDSLLELLAIERSGEGITATLWDPVVVSSPHHKGEPGEPLRRRWQLTADGHGDGRCEPLALRLGAPDGPTPPREPEGVLRPGIVDTAVLSDFPGGRTVAVDLADGHLRWEQRSEERVEHQVAAARADGGTTLVQLHPRGLRAVDAATGAPLWSSDTAEAAIDRLTLRADETLQEVRAADLDSDHNDDLLLAISRIHRRPDRGHGELAAVDGVRGRLLWRRAGTGGEVFPPPGVPGAPGAPGAPGSGASITRAPGEPTAVALLRWENPERPWVEVVEGGSGHLRWSAPAPASSEAMTVHWWPGEPSPPRGPAGPRDRGTAAMVVVLHSAGVEFRRGDDGAIVGEYALAPRIEVAPAHLDWDGDGRLDLILAGEDRELVGLRPTGEWTGAVAMASDIREIQAIGDINRDGFADLLVAAAGPQVLSGRRLLWQRQATDALRATPIVADLDGDGSLEVAANGGFLGKPRLCVFDASSGLLRACATEGGDQTLRPPVVIPAAAPATGLELLVIHSGKLLRLAGHDASLLAEVAIPQSYSSPVVVDLDGDGALDSVIITPWNARDPLEIRRLPGLGRVATADLGEPGDGAWGAPTSADLDGDGRPELVLGLHRGGVLAIDGDGQRRWRVELGHRQVYAPAAADLDGDGRPELLASAAGAGESLDLVALDGGDGHELRRWPGFGAPLGGATLWSSPSGERRLFAATEARGLVALAVDGDLLWDYRITAGDGPQPRATAPLVLADLDGDGALELLATFADGALHVVDAASGRRRWRYRTDDPNIEATPVAADLDGDGVQEVILAGHDRQLVVLRSPRPPR